MCLSRRYNFTLLFLSYKSVNMLHGLAFGVDCNGSVQQGVQPFFFLGLGFAGEKEGMIGWWAGIWN